MEAVKTNKEPQGAQAQCSRFSVNGELSTQSDAFILFYTNFDLMSFKQRGQFFCKNDLLQ